MHLTNPCVICVVFFVNIMCGALRLDVPTIVSARFLIPALVSLLCPCLPQDVECEAGQGCRLQEVECVRAPCPAVPVCVDLAKKLCGVSI